MGIWNPKANSLFLQVIELSSSDQRAGFLDEACAGDPALRTEVEQLLKAHDSAGSFLERPLLDEQRTQDFLAATDPNDPLAASDPRPAEVSLDFLDPCDVPGRLGKIGPYEVIDVIGVGGMGVVLRAHEPKLNRIVAVKVMAPQLVVNPTARKRFLREAQAAAAVTHPNVVAIHAIEQTEKMSYLVMECINGQSLEQKLDCCGHLDSKEILRIGAQISAGLAAAHAQGLVHRDIKPSNILLENGVERVRITDFGLARAVDDVGVTCSGEVAGTPQFMSPEQAQGKPVDHRSDLFSLGAVLYTMSTGRSPFRAETAVAVLRRVCDDVPRPLWEVNPDIPEQLVTIIDRLLAKAPEERFQTAQQVSDLLLVCLADLQGPGGTASTEPLCGGPAADRKTIDPVAAPIRRWPRRTKILGATVMLGLCLSVAVTESTGVTSLTATIVRIVTGSKTDPPGQYVDLLPGLDLDRDRVAGSWTKSDAALTSEGLKGRIMMPIRIEGEYDLLLTFTRQYGDHFVGVMLPVGSHNCMLVLGEGDKCDLEYVDGRVDNATMRHDKPIVNGRLYTVEVKVRLKDGMAAVDASLDNSPFVHWDGRESSLSTWVTPRKQQIMLVLHDCAARFHSVQLRMRSGKASPAPTPPTSAQYWTPARREANLLVDGSFEKEPLKTWHRRLYNNKQGSIEIDDKNAKHGKQSVVIRSKEPVDCCFYQSFACKPQTPYLLGGWVKTENVKAEGDRGAAIGIGNIFEFSESLIGTNDWTYVTCAFDSRDQTSIDVAARLGHVGSLATGTAWFDDLCLMELSDDVASADYEHDREDAK